MVHKDVWRHDLYPENVSISDRQISFRTGTGRRLGKMTQCERHADKFRTSSLV